MAAPTRTSTVLPILKTLIWAIIAIALVKFAFFPAVSAKDGAQSLDPGGDYSALTVAVAKSDITNTVSAKGTVESDPAVVVKATVEGTVTYRAVADGATVSEGDALLELRKEIQGDDTQTTDEAGNVHVVPGKRYYEYVTIHAPAAGIVRMNALVDQHFGVGEQIGTIQPPTYSAVANLNGDQLYRIQDDPSEATLTITNGPAPFQCTGLKIVTPQSSSSNQGNQNDASRTASTSSSSVQAKCAIPDDQKVFPGLQVTMDIVSGNAEGVLSLPISAVEGRFQNGFVYVPGADGAAPEKKEVVLGLTDGTSIEIKSGLNEGDEVLEFIPNSVKDENGNGVPDDEEESGPGMGGGLEAGVAF